MRSRPLPAVYTASLMGRGGQPIQPALWLVYYRVIYILCALAADFTLCLFGLHLGGETPGRRSHYRGRCLGAEAEGCVRQADGGRGGRQGAAAAEVITPPVMPPHHIARHITFSSSLQAPVHFCLPDRRVCTRPACLHPIWYLLLRSSTLDLRAGLSGRGGGGGSGKRERDRGVQDRDRDRRRSRSRDRRRSRSRSRSRDRNRERDRGRRSRSRDRGQPRGRDGAREEKKTDAFGRSVGRSE